MRPGRIWGGGEKKKKKKKGNSLRELTGTHAMARRLSACAAVLALCVLVSSPAAQTVYPTGTTIYDPDRSWNGFTVLSPLGTPAVLVIDMNGTVVKRWEDFNNSAGGPARVLPGGIVMAARGARPPHQESLELIRRDFDGKDPGSSRAANRSPRARAAWRGQRVSTTTGSWRAFRRGIARPGTHRT